MRNSIKGLSMSVHSSWSFVYQIYNYDGILTSIYFKGDQMVYSGTLIKITSLKIWLKVQCKIYLTINMCTESLFIASWRLSLMKKIVYFSCTTIFAKKVQKIKVQLTIIIMIFIISIIIFFIIIIDSTLLMLSSQQLFKRQRRKINVMRC